jgi:DNA-binding response OmpR family regulator
MALSRHRGDDNIRVLFIEDDAAVAEMYKLKLELDGYEVTIVSGGEGVVDRMASLRPDLVFLDVRRRQGEAVEILRAVRATHATQHVPVIILSNQRPQDMAGIGFGTDAMDYVVRADTALSSLTDAAETGDQTNALRAQRGD